MRVLVTGAGGQLGRDLVEAYAAHDVTGLTRDQLDISSEVAVTAAIRDLGPRLVINAAAWTDVDGCEADPDRAHAVNALGPWWLARACERTGATLVHVSTDYVFGGPAPSAGGPAPSAGGPAPSAGGPAPSARAEPCGWTEFDAVAPVNVYGRTKAAGEVLVRQTLAAHHIVRTSWLAGASGGNFVTTVLRLARERGELAVVDDQYGCPTFSRDLAGAIVELAASGRSGTLHRANAGHASRFELAVAVVETCHLDAVVKPQSSSQVDRAAARPGWTVLDDRHARAIGLTPLPPWRDGLERLLRELGEI